MLIHRDGFIELNYDAATDILTVSWPDIAEPQGFALEHAFGKLVDTIRHYDIKKLIIDSRFNTVHMQEEEYTELMKRFHASLSTTRLAMAARLGSLDASREERAAQHAARIVELVNPTFSFRNFARASDALDWLKAG